METNYSRQELTLEGRQANWEVCVSVHTTLVKANTAQQTKSVQSDTATTEQTCACTDGTPPPGD